MVEVVLLESVQFGFELLPPIGPLEVLFIIDPVFDVLVGQNGWHSFLLNDLRNFLGVEVRVQG